jgi:uncharacterized Fe-S cluster-containing protein
MFAIIHTNGATHIAIHVPHAGADRSLPALAAMLEQNTTFIHQGYQELKTVKPSMSISLGNEYRCENYDLELAVVESGAVIGDEFVIASPEVFASNAKSLKKKDEELAKLRTELSFVKSQLDSANAALSSLREERDNTQVA